MDDIFKKRHSVRFFSNKKVEKTKLEKILEAANSAPSAGNLKSREIIVICDNAGKEKLMDLRPGKTFFSTANTFLIFLADPEKSGEKYGERGRKLYSIQDATISASFAWLQAVSLGLSCVWVGTFDDEVLKKMFSIKKTLKPVCILPVGYEVNSE